MDAVVDGIDADVAETVIDTASAAAKKATAFRSVNDETGNADVEDAGAALETKVGTAHEERSLEETDTRGR